MLHEPLETGQMSVLYRSFPVPTKIKKELEKRQRSGRIKKSISAYRHQMIFEIDIKMSDFLMRFAASDYVGMANIFFFVHLFQRQISLQ